MSDEAPLAIKSLADQAKTNSRLPPRSGQTLPVVYVIVLAVIAVVGSSDRWLDIAAFWQARNSLHRRLFAHDYGIPAHATLRRVFILLPFASIQHNQIKLALIVQDRATLKPFGARMRQQPRTGW